MPLKPTYDELVQRVKKLEQAEMERKKRVALFSSSFTESNRAEEGFFEIFSMALDMICIADLDTAVFLKVNPAFTEILGYSENEFLNRPFFDFIHPDDIDSTKSVIEQKLRMGKKVIDFENRYRCKDGSYRWLSWVSHPIPEKGKTYAIARDVTQIKQTETRLRESEKRYRRLFNATNDGISLHEIVFDKGTPVDYRILDVNPQYEAMIGINKKDAVGALATDLYKTDHAPYLDAYTEAAKTGKTIVFESFFPPMNKHFLITVFSPEKNRFATVFQNITERKEVERELIQSRAQLRLLINTIPDLVWLKDSDGVYISCNKKFERLFGVNESEIVGKTDYDFVDKPLANFFREHDRKAIEMDKPSVNEEWLTFASDQYRGLFETIKTPMHDPNGKLIGVLGIAREITQRKMTEDALKLSQERYKSAQRMGLVGNWEYNLRSEKFWGSDQAKRIYGFEPESNRFTTDEVENCIPERERVHQALIDLIEEGKPYHLEFEIHPISGPKKRTIRSIAELVKDEQGTPLKVIGVIQDITKEKEVEKEKQSLAQQLKQAQKMEAIGRLAGGVAHDFNNMLSIILGNIEFMLEDLDSSNPLFENLKEIQKAGQRSADLTRQLLAFARKQIVSPIVLNLNETIEGMLEMLRRLIGEDIHLSWHPKVPLWPVKMDPSQIDQLLVNLCVNARDAIDDVGEITIETDNVEFDLDYCKKHSGSKPGRYVLIGISDNGCGIDKENLENLFEPFFTTKEIGEGTGLGLATVYGIVKQNKGFINVYSEPGQGTTFKIYLPKQMKESENQGQNVAQKEPHKGHETILLVEDEEAILRMTCMMLERLGYNVFTANTPAEAIQICDTLETKIHLLMTDVVMPLMNGPDLFDKLRRIRPTMQCLFMSGYTANLIAQRGILDKEECNFISKPFSKYELATKLRSLFDQKNS